jgi:murein L,D-transpeptidase YafK
MARFRGDTGFDGSSARFLTRRTMFGGLALTALGLAASSAKGEARLEQADRILVLKSERKLLLLGAGAVLGVFPIALGRRPIGPKRFEGDLRTPEGIYWIDAVNPRSRFHLALRISYPNTEDVARARAAGLMPGGNIEIHGMPESYGLFDPVVFYKDWTNGCIAVGNRAIEQIWVQVDIGTPVEIRA